MADMQISGITIHNFCESLLDKKVHFHVMKMQDSVFIWIGSKLELSTMSVAMCSKYTSGPVATNLFGEISEITSNSFAKKFAKRLKKQCFVSYNLPPDNNLLGLVEAKIIKEIESKPEKF